MRQSNFLRFLSFVLCITILLSVSINANHIVDETSTIINYSDNLTPAISQDELEVVTFTDELSVEVQQPNDTTSDYSTLNSLNYEYEGYLFTVEFGIIGYDSTNNVFGWTFNIDCKSHIINKPDIVVTFSCNRDITDGTGLYTQLKITDEHGKVFDQLRPTNGVFEIDSLIDYGTTYDFYTERATGYYYINYNIEIVDEVILSGGNENTVVQLFNKTGHVWNFEFSDGLGKVLRSPRADWVRGYIVDRNAVDYKTLYVNEYKLRTGITLTVGTETPIHHQQPLYLGGTHDYNNLIHLTKSLHDSINGWYNGYL